MPKNITLHTTSVFVTKTSWELRPDVEDLYITGNVFGGHGVAKIASAFKTNTTLKRLILSGCNVEQIGLNSFLDVLKNNDTLEVLHIEYGIPLNDDSTIKLIDMVRCNKGLKKIVIKHVSIQFTRLHLLNLEESVKNNTNLMEFKIIMQHTSDNIYNSVAIRLFNSAIQKYLQSYKIINNLLANLCSELILKQKIEVPDYYPKILIEQNFITYDKY